MLGGTTGILAMGDGSLDTVRPSMLVRKTVPSRLCTLGRVHAPVIAVLHNLDDAFTGHAGPALHAAGVELDERFLKQGDPLPSLEDLDGILSFGGFARVVAARAVAA